VGGSRGIKSQPYVICKFCKVVKICFDEFDVGSNGRLIPHEWDNGDTDRRHNCPNRQLRIGGY
jgi:hypothetical protein